MEEELQVDWNLLKNPPEPYKLIVPDYESIEFHKKLIILKEHLLTKYLETSDEHRNEKYVDYAIKGGFFTLGTAVYEAGEFQAVLGFVNIVPDFKCGMIFNLLDKKIWGKELVRASQELIDIYMEQFNLKRITAQTADPKIVKMCKMVGFKVDGECPKDFQWKGKLFPRYILGLTREEE